MARKPKKPADMSFLLQTSQGTLAQISKKTNYLKRFDDLVQQSCPDLPKDVWRIANFRQKTVVIEVKSSVWSQRLQFERMNISHSIAQFTDNAFDKIEIKVAPHFNKTPKPELIQILQTPNTRTLTSENAAQLREVAKKAPESLQKKIERLACLGDKKTTNKT